MCVTHAPDRHNLASGHIFMVFPREKVTVAMVGRTHVQSECVPMGVLSLLIGTRTMPPVSLWSLSAQKAVTPSLPIVVC